MTALKIIAWLTFAGALPAYGQTTEATFNAGVARVVITPEESMWMGGYAARKKPSEGKVHDLFAKALAIEDERGTKLVIVTVDLIGIPRSLRDTVEAAVKKSYGLPAESLLLNASHTHCGPEMRIGKAYVFGLDARRVQQAREYRKRLETQLAELVGRALDDLKPAKLSYTHARAGLAMNRRTPSKGKFINHPNPDGPVDHDVPLLKVESADGALRALLFGYACHNTTLGFYKFCGDYAGFAQAYLEEAHPETTALFMMGCGGDQNPYPRGQLELARQHGRALANGVEAALQTKSRPIVGPLAVVYDETTIEFAPPPTRDDLNALKENGNKYDHRRAIFLLEELDSSGKINAEYSYPIHVAQFGRELTMVSLAGEVVVDYSLRLKEELPGPAVWIAGYSNDVFGYVPSRRVLSEGGYEAGGAMRYSLLPGPFAASVESRIVEKVHELARHVRPE